MKYYNVELPLNDAERLNKLLKELGVKYEVSGCYHNYHFEILLERGTKEYEMIDNFLACL